MSPDDQTIIRIYQCRYQLSFSDTNGENGCGDESRIACHMSSICPFAILYYPTVHHQDKRHDTKLKAGDKLQYIRLPKFGVR